MAGRATRHGRMLAAGVLVGALVAGACSGDGSGEGDEDAAPSPPTEGTTATSAAPSVTTTPATTAGTGGEGTDTGGGEAAGPAGPGCEDGWTTPAPGTPERVDPLDVIRAQLGVTGTFQVQDMRYFTSPEVPQIVEPRPPFVEWWYVKATLSDDPTVRARWLVARRSPTVMGVAAVARFDTTGYRSPDWRAFIGDGEPRELDGIPGRWVGIEFDFTVGEDGQSPGLPVEAVACLDGT